MSKRRKLLHRILYRFVKQVLFKIKIRGTRNICLNEPLIVVSNHVGSFGPVSIMSSIPLKLHPWVTHEITDIRECSDYIQKAFTEAELRWKSPLSRYFSRIIGRLCVSLMRGIEAIPVYRRSRRIRNTLQKTLLALEAGMHILIFPENPEQKIDDGLCRFNSGFVSLVRHFHRRTNRIVPFIPVAVNRKVKTIKIGKPIYFDTKLPFLKEKYRLVRELEEKIFSMYHSLESGTDILSQSSEPELRAKAPS